MSSTDDTTIHDNTATVTSLNDKASLLDSYIERLAEAMEASFAKYTIALPDVLRVLKENKIVITKAELAKAISQHVSAKKAEQKRLQAQEKAAEQSDNSEIPTPEDGVQFAITIAYEQPIDGTSLVSQIRTIIDRHMIFVCKGSSLVIALWSIGTHVFPAWRIFPRLFVTATDSGCRKTTLMDIIELLVHRAKKAESITAAAVYRMIEEYRPTLLIDEADVCVKGDDND
jgi:hypothetical protein